MPVTAAISTGIGAIGSLGSAFIGANASQKASNQQVAQQQLALQQQKDLYNQGLGIATNALNPFIGIGGSVGATLQSLLTPGSSAATLAQMPGFGFASQYGTMAATNALAAKTGASAGPLATAISQYNNGLASQQYFNTVNALQSTFGTGASAAAALAGPALGASVNEGNAQAGTLTNTGNALASGTLGAANAFSNGLTGATGNASNALLYSQLFGNGGSGLYTPAQIGKIGQMDASQITDAQAEAYGKAMGF